MWVKTVHVCTKSVLMLDLKRGLRKKYIKNDFNAIYKGLFFDGVN